MSSSSRGELESLGEVLRRCLAYSDPNSYYRPLERPVEARVPVGRSRHRPLRRSVPVPDPRQLSFKFSEPIRNPERPLIDLFPEAYS